jgi:hypothetical protein
MTFETPNFVKQLVGGWPVYAVVGTALLLFSELWIDRKVDDRIAFDKIGQPLLTVMDKKIDVNATKLESLTAGQTRIEGQLRLLTEHLLAND